jgi:multiple sugar transport system substrate-binding protein
MSKKLVAAVAGAVLLAAGLAGCGGDDSPSGGKVTLHFSWWGSDTRATLTDRAVKAFEAAHPGVTVQTDYAAYAPYWQKIATETAGGNAPDVIQMDYRYLSEYGRRNALLDLRKQDLPVTDLEPAVAGSGQIDGKTVAVPFGQNTTAIAINDTALRKLGLAKPTIGTWAAFKTWAGEVHTKSGGKVYGVSDMGYAEDVFELWLRQSGKALYTPDGKLGFSAADLTAFWTMWQDMVKSGAATPAEISNQYDGSTAKSALVQGRSVAEFIFDNTLGSTQAAMKDQLSLVTFPTDGAQNGMYYKPTMLLSASRQGKHPAEAAALIDFLVNDPGAGQILGADRGLPPNGKVRAAVLPSLKAADQIVVEYEQGARLAATPPAPPKGDGEVKNDFQAAYQAVTSGKTSIADAVTTLLQQAQQATGV